jgi:hypothetical protein
MHNNPTTLSMNSLLFKRMYLVNFFMIFCFWFAEIKTHRAVTAGGEKHKKHTLTASAVVDAEDSNLL